MTFSQASSLQYIEIHLYTIPLLVFLNISFFEGGLELMVDEVHVSLPGTKQQGWTKLLFNGNQVIENKLGCCLSIAYNMTGFF